jgi:hypothetical protein
MQVLYSFWTKPSISSTNEKFTGGWQTPTQHWCSWVLSTLTASQHYPIHLITDQQGKHILVDTIGLPFNGLSTDLEDLKDLDPRLWAFGKLYAYQLQKEPFISVDADVYLWDRLPVYLENADLICQDFEYFDGKRGVIWLYEEAKKHTKNCQKPYFYRDIQYAANAGIFGGSRLEFFKILYEETWRFLKENKQILQSDFPMQILNIYCEQYFAACLSEQLACSFTPLRTDFESWELLFARQRYTHLIAHSKKDLGHEVEAKVKKDYPEYYQRILAMQDFTI